MPDKVKPEKLDVMETAEGWRVYAWVDKAIYVHHFASRQKSVCMALKAKVKTAGEIDPAKWTKVENRLINVIDEILGPIDILKWERGNGRTAAGE